MKERIDLENYGNRLFEEIQKINLANEIEETVLFGDIGSLFPEYQLERIRNTKHVDMAWLFVYALAIVGVSLAGAALFYSVPFKEISLWACLAGFSVILYSLNKRVPYMDRKSMSQKKVRRSAFWLFSLTLILTISTAVGALAATTVHVATVILSAG